ncbi:conserved hypothetical protein [Aeromonas veronii]|uniref:Uncharacterized protein n=1 Tax=Aeromonas veronii TaxID=654 RepID=A0A653LE88_AERVE|nr:conserved hypothetical protein [Aeromonas veronii]
MLDEQINDSFDAHQIHFDLYKFFYKHFKNNNLNQQLNIRRYHEINKVHIKDIYCNIVRL